MDGGSVSEGVGILRKSGKSRGGQAALNLKIKGHKSQEFKS